MNENLRLSSAGANLIKHFEGCLTPHQGKVKAYKCPAGVATIGWGHTNHHGKKFDLSTVWTQEQCDAELLSDMEVFEKRVRSLVTVPLEPWQYDALVSFDYNTGALHKSTLLKKVNSGDHKGAAAEFKRWNKANGKELAGLTRRRASESLLYQNIPDTNYDGKADPKPPAAAMAQAVDSPED